MKSRCAPMSAEDRQAHHLFISHHCRITARCLPRLVGRFVVRGIITKPSLFPPLVFVLFVVSVLFAFPIPDFPKPRLISLSPPISPNPKPYIFPKLGVSLSSFRNSEHPYAFAKLCSRSRTSRNLIRLFCLFFLFAFFAFFAF